MRIIALDDEPLSLHLLVSALRETVPDAEIASFTASAPMLAAAQTAPADIYFLDIQMPGPFGTEIAAALTQSQQQVNIVFVTGFDAYKADAMDLHASDYLMKPVTPEKIRCALENLRFPVRKAEHVFRAQTFGHFVLYADDKPVTFHRRKSAELFAYLTDRTGAVISRAELTWILFGDETHSRASQKNLANVYRGMMDDLTAVDADCLIFNDSAGIAVNRALLQSDLFQYLDGHTALFQGEYMEQYGWGEEFKALHTVF